MKKLTALFLMIAAMCSVTQAQYKGKYVGWSTGYVYGGGTLNAGLYKAFTHLVNFHITVTASGGLGTGDLPQSNQPNFVSMCHANGIKALLCIGGAGEHAHFVAACSNASTQTTLVKNIMNMVISNGYDGVDLDWEVAEDPNYDNSPANVATFLAFHKQVRDSIRAHPPLMITAAVTDDWYPNCSAAVCPIVDQANGMSYDISAANEYKDASIVFKLGAPKSNHGIGFDMSNPTDNLAKCRLAIDSSFGGIMAWSVTNGSTAAYDSIAHYVTHSPTNITSFSQSRNETRLFVRSGAHGGLTLVSYSGPASANGSLVDLGMYNIKGQLVKTLFRGVWNSGPIVVPMDYNNAGAYFFRLSTNSKVLTTRAIAVK